MGRTRIEPYAPVGLSANAEFVRTDCSTEKSVSVSYSGELSHLLETELKLKFYFVDFRESEITLHYR